MDVALAGNGNSKQIALSSLTYQNGSKGETGVIALDTNNEVTLYERVVVPAEIASLPNLIGGGQLRDLHQEMALRPELVSRVRAFTLLPVSHSSLEAEFHNLLLVWAGADGVTPGSRGKYMDARRLAYLEARVGSPFWGVAGPNPVDTAAEILEETFGKAAKAYFAIMVFQSQLAPLSRHLGQDELANASVRRAVHVNAKPAQDWLDILRVANPAEADAYTRLFRELGPVLGMPADILH